MFRKKLELMMVEGLVREFLDKLIKLSLPPPLLPMITKLDEICANEELYHSLEPSLRIEIEAINTKVVEVFAHSLSAQVHKKFKKLNIKEIDSDWSKAVSFHRLGSVWDLQSIYIAFTILSIENPGIRKVVIERWIAVARVLTREQNFFSGHAVFTALTQTNVERLYRIKDGPIQLSETSQVILTSLNAFYGNPNEILKKVAAAEGPKIGNAATAVGAKKESLEGGVLPLEGDIDKLKAAGLTDENKEEIAKIEKKIVKLKAANREQCETVFHSVYVDYSKQISANNVSLDLLKDITGMKVPLASAQRASAGIPDSMLLTDIIDARKDVDNYRRTQDSLSRKIEAFKKLPDQEGMVHTLEKERALIISKKEIAQLPEFLFNKHLYDLSSKYRLRDPKEQTAENNDFSTLRFRKRLSAIFGKRSPSTADLTLSSRERVGSGASSTASSSRLSRNPSNFGLNSLWRRPSVAEDPQTARSSNDTVKRSPSTSLQKEKSRSFISRDEVPVPLTPPSKPPEEEQQMPRPGNI